ncbi:hypothetical protein, partial [Bartonella sp. CL27QHWL]|uniref:hypothetical protein n=1 Tax=Bartonella sp. CL27QHWL TaxID=3243521 RepID=UPI0035CFB11F
LEALISFLTTPLELVNCHHLEKQYRACGNVKNLYNCEEAIASPLRLRTRWLPYAALIVRNKFT